MSTITHDDYSQTIYNVPVGLCIQQTSIKDYKYEEKRNSALIFPGEYNSKKEPKKIIERENYALIHFTRGTHLILSGSQPEFLYFILLAINIAFCG